MTTFLLVIAAGFLAGFINTIAGSGSIVTMTLLYQLGLPAKEANGTNRIGVLAQSIAGFKTYQANSEPLEIGKHKALIILVVLGAILGSYLGVLLNEELFKTAFGYLLIGLLLVVLFKPAQWLRKESTLQPQWPVYIRYPAYFAVGIYGGFIQAGVGVLLLASLILGAGFHMAKANSIKLLIVLIYTVPSLIIYIYHGQVVWLHGLLLAIGQTAGAYVSAKWATSYPDSPKWIRRLLIAIILVSIPRFLGFF